MTLLEPDPIAVAQKTSAVAKRLEYNRCSRTMNLRHDLRYLASRLTAKNRGISLWTLDAAAN